MDASPGHVDQRPSREGPPGPDKAGLRVGHSPDADDAFMFYAIAKGAVDTGPFRIEHVVEDIESLNRRALTGELEVTAISAAIYPQVAHHYRIMACGASIGRQYGPVLVARQPVGLESLAGKRVAIPGLYTTAYLLLRLYAPQVQAVAMPFDAIMQATARGDVDAGLLIHEGQITFGEAGLSRVADLGQLWHHDTGLPIPLGLDMAHRRLGDQAAQQVYHILSESIRYAREHEDEAIAYAQRYSRGLDTERCRRFVRMYVNDDTTHMGEEGRRALEALYRKAQQRGIIQDVPSLDIIGLNRDDRG